MNRAEWIKTVLEAGRSVLGIIALGAVLILLFVSYRSCQAKSEALARLERAEEAHEIDLAKRVRVHEADLAAREETIEELKAESADFRSAYANAVEALDARPVFVATASTGPVPVEPTALKPDPFYSEAEVELRVESVHPILRRRPNELDPDPFHVEREPGCLLWPGDSGEVRVTQAVVETRKGNRVLVGAAEALRVSPEPSLRLFGGEFSTPVTMALGEPVAIERKKGWIYMGGPVVAVTGEGGHFGGHLGAISPPVLFDHVAVGVTAGGGKGFGMGMLHFVWRP